MATKRSDGPVVPAQMNGGFGWGGDFIAVDWGTTNRRAYLVRADGTAEDVHEDGLGVLSVPKGGFPAEIAALRARVGERPMLLAGMIGSNRGWVEAPYVAAPAGLNALVGAICWPQDRVGIVPGVSWRDGGDADVMRGEEVQILGALAEGLIAPDALVCHPGTHAKWIRMEASAIGPFRTMMTGELFSLLKTHSILSDLLAGDVADNVAFAEGARHAIAHDDLTAELFSIRARHLVLAAGADDSASYASGLLIGADVKAGLTLGKDREIALVGRPDLTTLYATALRAAGRGSIKIDGERAFIAGARAIAVRLA